VTRSALTTPRSQPGNLTAGGQQPPDPCVVEPREREPERGERRVVEPLDVVDADADGALGRERPQGSEPGRGDRPLVDPRVGLAEQQGGLERASLHGRERRYDLLGRAVEEVGEPRVREARLRLGGPAGEHPAAAALGSGEPREPERRLADPRFTVEHDDVLRAGVETVRDGGELVLAPDEQPAGRGGGHPGPVSRRASSVREWMPSLR
jgi:hypothetical protein